jgi:hypothetical protein
MMSSAVGAASAGSIGYPIVKQVTTLATIKICTRHIEADIKRGREKGMKAPGWIIERGYGIFPSLKIRLFGERCLTELSFYLIMYSVINLGYCFVSPQGAHYALGQNN